MTITPPGGVADSGAYSWAIPSDFQMGKYQLVIETSDQKIDDMVEILVIKVDADMGDHLKRYIPHIHRPNPGHQFDDFCR